MVDRQENVAGLQLSERRLSGVTFGDVLDEYSQAHKLGLSGVPRGSEDRYFESVRVLDISPLDAENSPREHVVVEGKDRDMVALVRDGETVLQCKGNSISINFHSPDFSKMLVMVESDDYVKKDYLIRGEESWNFFEGERLKILAASDDLERFIISKEATNDKRKTEIWRVEPNRMGQLAGVSETGFPVFVAANEDFSQVVWSVRSHGRFGLGKEKTRLYRNGQRLCEGEKIHAYVNADASRVVSVVDEDRGVKIFINDKSIFGQKGIVCIGNQLFTQDISRGMLAVMEEGKYRLLVVNGDEAGLMRERFDDIVLREEDGKVKAEVKLLGAEYEREIAS